jgi:riboflavin kinase / FMN adenylyltransferase
MVSGRTPNCSEMYNTSTRLFRNDIPAGVLKRPVIVTLGSYDGIHRGHQRILEVAREQRASSEEGTVVMVSFYPHPSVVLGVRDNSPVLTNLRQKLDILGRHGVDALYLIRFTRSFSQLTPREFIDEYLLRRLDLSHLFIGEDAAVGRGREGNATVLASHLATRGRSAVIVPFATEEGEKIASRTIRRYLAEGRVREAGVLLGRSYSIEGPVRRGEQRGRALGTPTLNLMYGNAAVPRTGVYATFTRIGKTIAPSVTNVGTKPTFGTFPLGVETHLLEPVESGYGDRVEVFFVERLRDEETFPDAQALQARIRADIRNAKAYLDEASRATIARWCGL